jgi:hypothetical protein
LPPQEKPQDKPASAEKANTTEKTSV